MYGNKFELNYKELIRDILENGEYVAGRNGVTKRLFAKTLVIDDLKYGNFPILTSRKMYWKGVAGEFAAMLRKPKNIKDFEKFGCNYWKLWAGENGKLELDYGNAWLDWNGINQLDYVINSLKTNPNDRRMLINGWRADKVINNELSLPCCHYSYQFFLNINGEIELLWNQRSADIMIGIPSDIIFAALWLTTLANHTGYKAGKITMVFGDTHIYKEHLDGAKEYLKRPILYLPEYINKCKDIYKFVPDDIELINYQYNPQIKFELKG